MTLQLDKGATVLHRVGAQLVEISGETRAVLEADGDEPRGFLVAAGAERELTTEEATRLARLLRCDQWLHPGPARARMVEGALLDGGRLCAGKPAYGLRLSGEGIMRAWFFADGTPAGYGFQDPVAKVYVEVFASDGDCVRIHHDGKFTSEGTLASAAPADASALVRRAR